MGARMDVPYTGMSRTRKAGSRSPNWVGEEIGMLFTSLRILSTNVDYTFEMLIVPYAILTAPAWE